MTTRALFFSRGRGHGHAIPDIAIADAVTEAGGDIDFQFASYATGAATFAAAGRKVFNLGLPENNPFLPTLFEARKLIDHIKPHVVVSHEEFAALPAAVLSGIPSVFIGGWFPPEASVRAEALAYASSIVMIEQSGLFPAPLCLNAKPLYVGPPLRKMKFGLKDRENLRDELSIPREAVVLVVVAGGAAAEKSTPILETVLSAYISLERPEKRLFWLSAKDAAAVKNRTAGITGVVALPFVDPIERLLAAADVVITKGTQMITLDCASIGVPSISLSSNTNPIDDILIPRISSNLALNARAVDGESLRDHLEKILTRSPLLLSPAINGDIGCKLAAETLIREIARLLVDEQ